ncbi:hypothetical protein [Azospirillum sp.]|uniref:hypothetical protein n=1 Tax=Azospirillum sp. TaxID=34012 RepID=UPI002D701F64|nr:hypothetical protein [Azospirillum sp.]HYD68785.1 hypothetical protein [Azospirillum sp.]
MDDDAKVPESARELTEAELSGAGIEALVVRLNAARRNAALARARAEYQDANNNHREAVHYERLVAANEKMPQAERKAIVESSPDVLKGRQQSIVHAKDAALWTAEAEALRLYILARTRSADAGETA